MISYSVTTLRQESCSFCNTGECSHCLHTHCKPRKTFFTKHYGLPFTVVKGCGCEELGHIMEKERSRN